MNTPKLDPKDEQKRRGYNELARQIFRAGNIHCKTYPGPRNERRAILRDAFIGPR